MHGLCWCSQYLHIRSHCDTTTKMIIIEREYLNCNCNGAMRHELGLFMTCPVL